ncbi:hypothetical protein ElyMa_006073500 [Elysia marginata]|uniref:Uncharacterized protein n=1 Tax=Elysia marginata TaxID=1093978 RepID=A0AAV4GP46_9GAST|nr:hypothetical protein ElyMa_006073500 [Elysia marginata]
MLYIFSQSNYLSYPTSPCHDLVGSRIMARHNQATRCGLASDDREMVLQHPAWGESSSGTSEHITSTQRRFISFIAREWEFPHLSAHRCTLQGTLLVTRARAP